MEQHRTRSPNHPQRRPQGRRPALPPQYAEARPRGAQLRGARGGRRVPLLRRLPNPRLTGLGGGLFACAAMAVVAGLDWLLFDGSMIAYGLLFVLVAATTALWVRPADLVTAPIAVPIAFAAGVWPIAGGSGGFGGQLMGVVTALALHAGWLYAGTLLAALIVLVRKAVLISRRRRPKRAAAG
ncbi:DUF6542 domain-containing protein [Streptomyces sp. NRRL S-87]|uniref:DUF6542 domain-containing protein n=1 Tax=Streptomyces sp. NRRL S-87 TaxID=1463920 RepID=UPI0004C1A172|nr:DUF6542 domain-containing protein [Streptomyces sp. NRRL S-87]